MNHKIINIILAIAIIGLLAINIKTCGKISDIENINISKDDTITKIINKNGQQEATIAIMQGTVAEFKKLNANKDSTIARLQKVVDRHTISATAHGTVTGNTVLSVSTIIKYDTVITSNKIEVFPTYTTKFKNRWENFNITASQDSIKIDYKLFNEFNYVIRNNRSKWYKPRVAEITVTNLNPHTETIELKNFTVKPPKNQKLLVFLGGAIIGSISTIATIKLANQLIK